MMYYDNKSKSYILKRGAFSYVSLRINLSHWALPLRIQKFTWNHNGSVEYYVHLLCFNFCFNSYGVLVRGKDWPYGEH